MRLLSLNDLRRKLGGRSRSSIYRDVELGRLPRPAKIGRLNYWPEDEVEAAVARQRVPAANFDVSGGTS